MKAGFELGTKVRSTRNPNVSGKLVYGPSSSKPGWRFPHYEGEGFYAVKWDSKPGQTMIVHEDDIELFFAPDEDDEPRECPMCGGPSGVMGTLGKRTHYNCRNCGAWSS
jgi:hypothetical protein